jgi:DNA-binding NarL/FixJ family response regulator
MAVLQAGANGYVLKTAPPADIILAVREVNAGRSVLDPTITQKVMAQVSGQRSTLPIEQLTEREMEVLTLVGRGYTNKAIGVQLGISDRTVQGHLARIFGKLQAASRTEAVMRAVSLGWLPSDLGVPLDNG